MFIKLIKHLTITFLVNLQGGFDLSPKRKPKRKRRKRRRRKRYENPTHEDVLKRNYVEQIKQDKEPYDVIDDLPDFIDMPYEAIPEDDILRLQWYGLYHDKPKIGNFMMRVVVPGGVLSPKKARTIGKLALEYGRNYGEITTRQSFQLHWLRLNNIPDIFSTLEDVGLTTQGACGDHLRNLTGCPVAGLEPEEPFDPTPVLNEVDAFFRGNREYSDLPRKYKFTISSCPYHCNLPEIHDIGLIGTIQEGREGFAIWTGGGLSTFPRIADSMKAFVPKEEALEFLRAATDVWRYDYKYRMSRAKARFKFMVEDHGAEEVRRRIEKKLGRTLIDLKQEPEPVGHTTHMGVHKQRQHGLYYIGFPVFPGVLHGDQLVAVADVTGDLNGDIRLTRNQNLIVTGVPEAQVDEVIQAMDSIGLSLDTNPVKGQSMGCTGNPYCNFAVGETKPRLVKLIDHLEPLFGDKLKDLHIHLDGCPHACGQHYIGDVGIQGTTRTLDGGEKIQAYDIYVHGGMGQYAEIGDALMRRVPWYELNGCVERLLDAYFDERTGSEAIQEWADRRSDDELIAIMSGGNEDISA